MRDVVTVVFNSHGVRWDALRSLLLGCGLDDYAAQGPDPLGVHVVKLETDATVECLLNGLETHGLTWSVSREHVFSDAELHSAPMLRLVVRRPPRGVGGPKHGTEFDLTGACDECGSGARQASALVLDEREAPKRGPVVETLTSEVLVSGPLKRAIEELSPRGLELRDVLGRQSGQPLDFSQLIPTGELPRMDSRTKGIVRERPCPRCDRDGYFETMAQPLVIRYSADVVLNADAYFTYESFGNSQIKTPFVESHFARPLILVSQRIHDVFVAARVPSVSFEPVEFES